VHTLSGGESDIGDWLASFRKSGYDPKRVENTAYQELSSQEKEYVCKDLEFIETNPVGIIVDGDRNYPRNFSDFLGDSRPRALFCMGDITLLNCPSICVCGARAASKPGQEIAYKCGRLIADAGYVLSSGYARGVDIAAHQGALEAGGSTVALLPYGLSRFSVRQTLMDAFEPENFLAVSELPPSCGFITKAALRRNKLLVSLSDAVIVIEPGESGGTWFSAEKARSLKKKIFYHEGSRPEIIERMESLGGKRLKISRGVPRLKEVFRVCGEPS